MIFYPPRFSLYLGKKRLTAIAPLEGIPKWIKDNFDKFTENYKEAKAALPPGTKVTIVLAMEKVQDTCMNDYEDFFKLLDYDDDDKLGLQEPLTDLFKY